MWSTERRGFVLLEAVVALAIISLFVVALLGATGAQLRAASQAEVLVTARALAEERMTVLRLLSATQLSDVPDSLLAGVFPEPFGEYAWTAEVAPAEGELDLWTAVVVVSARAEAFPLTSMIHRSSALTTMTGGRQ